MKKIILSFVFLIILSFTSFASTENEEKSVMTLEYQNILEIKAITFSYGYGDEVDSFSEEIPVTVHYNNTYVSKHGNTITIDTIGLDDNGVPIMNWAVETKGETDHARIGKTIKYQTADGNYTEIETSALNYLVGSRDKKIEVAEQLFTGAELLETFQKEQIISIEVWLHQ